MTITAKIIADSINEQGTRITTMQLTYPRFFHAEFMTHRMFSRNASSSRAIPVSKMIADIRADTAMPIHWGKNQPGMQADEQHNAYVEIDTGLTKPVSMCRELAWLEARDRAIEVAEALHAAGYHKQVVNRILEPFMHISVIVTATNFENFYWLRRHADAQPEIKVLADAMFDAQMASDPVLLKEGEWHLPYVTEEDRYEVFYDRVGFCQTDFEENKVPRPVEDLIKISVARCARVSYLTHDGRKPNAEEDFKLYDRLVGSTPLHASPAEHQAQADEVEEDDMFIEFWKRGHLSGNFDKGFVQYRKTLSQECVYTYDG